METFAQFFILFLLAMTFVIWPYYFVKQCRKNNELIMENLSKEQKIAGLEDELFGLRGEVENEKKIAQLRLNAANRRAEEVLNISITNLYKMDL